MKKEQLKTILLDIDGTILSSANRPSDIYLKTQILLDGVLNKLDEWLAKGHQIILTTARTESTRKHTEQQLANLGISYHQLIMSLEHGPRILINDRNLKGESRAFAFNVDRNAGLDNIEI